MSDVASSDSLRDGTRARVRIFAGFATHDCAPSLRLGRVIRQVADATATPRSQISQRLLLRPAQGPRQRHPVEKGLHRGLAITSASLMRAQLVIVFDAKVEVRLQPLDTGIDPAPKTQPGRDH